MKNKFILSCHSLVIMLMVMMFFIFSSSPSVSADLGTFKQNDCISIKTILNSTSVNISSISYPNSTIILTNNPMTKIGYTFNYTFCNTSVLGIYTYDYNDNLGNVYVNSFTITSSGKTQSLFGLFFYIASLIILFAFLGLCILSFFKVDNILNRVSMIGISYLLLIGISFVSYQMCLDFIGYDALITNMMLYIFTILMYGTIIIFPIGFMWYMYSIYKIKEIESLINKGISEDEAIHRYKSRRKYG